MGILDDAIREHLELKRRRGADSAEVARQEREILGAATPGEPGYEAAAPAADAYDAGYDEPAVGGYAPDAPAYEEPAYADEDAAFDAAVAEPLAGSPLADAEPAAPAPAATQAVDDLFPGTGELLAAASQPAEAAPVAPAPPAPRADAPASATPAAPDDQEGAVRSGARRLSDEELAAWRKRLSERADRLAAQRPGGAAAPAAGADPAAPTAPAARPAAPAPQPADAPPAYWSGTAAAPATPAGGAPASDAPAAGQRGVGSDFFDAGDAESAFAPEPAPEPQADADHDVLDETPDFLQETPEHDRMWFEQRPPRDFDFG